MKICFITTGDIKSIATAKRALGLANPLSDLGWEVFILMEDTEENHHRVEMECDDRIKVYYFPHCSMTCERKWKNNKIKEIDPDFLYLCAFVTRNIVGVKSKCKRLVEHSELQSSIPDMKGMRKILCYVYEYYSLIYSDALLNASKYLQEVYRGRAKKLLCGKKEMLYYPYAFNKEVVSILTTNQLGDKFKQYLNKTTFVFLGTVTRNYGVFTILDAVKQLLINKYDNFRVIILGKGRHYDDAVEYVKLEDLLNNVEMPGYIPEEEISSYFSVASAFISPMNDTVQDWARCPSKLYLYLPYKKPVITCKIGEPYEILQDKGFYYSTGNSIEMAKQMQNVIDHRNILVDAHAELHSWKIRAEEFNEWIVKKINK